MRTWPGPISTNMPTPSFTSPRTACVNLTGAVSCSTSRAAMRCASSSFAVTVDMNGGAGFCQVAFASAGLRRSAARATSGLWNAPLTRSFTVLRAPRAAASSMQTVDCRVLAGDHDLARAVVVRRPDVRRSRGRAPRRRRPRGRAPPPSLPGVSRAASAIASPRSRTSATASPAPMRAGGRERRVLADRVADHEVRLAPDRLRPRGGRRSRSRRALAAGARFASVPRSIPRSRASPRRSRPLRTPRRTPRVPRGTPPRSRAPCPRPAIPGRGSRMRSS